MALVMDLKLLHAVAGPSAPLVRSILSRLAAGDDTTLKGDVEAVLEDVRLRPGGGMAAVQCVHILTKHGLGRY